MTARGQKAVDQWLKENYHPDPGMGRQIMIHQYALADAFDDVRRQEREHIAQEIEAAHGPDCRDLLLECTHEQDAAIARDGGESDGA